MSEPSATCANCLKPPALCVCDRITKLTAQHQVLILQHPQEQDRDLGTARLVELSLPKRAKVEVGLSWRSLDHAVGREVDRKQWGVLHLGQLPRPLTALEQTEPIVVLSKAGERMEPSELYGLVVLDGSWSQAKALWWRNPWLLKLPRVMLHPKTPSLYGKMRKEPRPECLSTLEAIAEALVALGEPKESGDTLKRLFRTLLQRARDAA